MTEDTSFNINAGILNRSAIVYTRRKINEPRTIPTALTKIPPCPRIVPPISRDASAIVTRRIVEEHQLTCLMITHNMQSAIDLGNRILMMDSGNIVLDIGGEEKKNMTVEGLLEKFRSGAGKALDNDRILLSD